MYHYLSRVFHCTALICLITLSGCSIFGNGQKAESLSLAAYDMSDSLKSGVSANWPSSWEIEQIEKDPYLYKINIADLLDRFSPAYAMLLKECGVGKNASANATTRELLVGLKDIKIIREENFLYNDQRIFYKDSSATLDDHNIKLSTLTRRENDCVYDTIIWSDDMQSGSVMDWFSRADLESLKKIYFAFSHT
jgi:hypothetical protein